MTTQIDSVPTAIQIGTQAAMGSWWLYDLYDPVTNSLPVFIDGDKVFSASGDISQAAFMVIGQPEYAVVSDVAQTDKMGFSIQCFKTDFDKIEAIRKSLNPCLLKADNGRVYYVKFDTRSWTLINTTDEYYIYDVNMIVVARPAP